ncbi:MAG: hypothetical protein C0475_04160 [Planctomyces sp.]|nr:hypothetical protein [Planctomyces sp.]
MSKVARRIRAALHLGAALHWRIAHSARAAALLVVAIAMAGWAPKPLTRPAIIGASASDGYQIRVTTADNQRVPVNAESVYLTLVGTEDVKASFHASDSFYWNPVEQGDRQANAALADDPTVVIAVDFLFWYAYAFPDRSADAPKPEEQARARLTLGLKALERFGNTPIALGDIPSPNEAMRALIGLAQRDLWLPSKELLDELNATVAAWAAKRPSVTIFKVSELFLSVHESRQLRAGPVVIPAEQTRALIQDDGLHPTARGLAVLVLTALDSLAQRGVIPQDSFKKDLAQIERDLPEVARTLYKPLTPFITEPPAPPANPDQPQSLADLASAEKLKVSRLLQIRRDEAPNLRPAAQAIDTFFMELTSSYRHAPADEVRNALQNYFLAFDDTSSLAHDGIKGTLVSWRDKIEPEVAGDNPDALIVDLWLRLNSVIPDHCRASNLIKQVRRPDGTVPAHLLSTFETIGTDLSHFIWCTEVALDLYNIEHFTNIFTNDYPKREKLLADNYLDFLRKRFHATYLPLLEKYPFPKQRRDEIAASIGELQDKELASYGRRGRPFDEIKETEKHLKIDFAEAYAIPGLTDADRFALSQCETPTRYARYYYALSASRWLHSIDTAVRKLGRAQDSRHVREVAKSLIPPEMHKYLVDPWINTSSPEGVPPAAQ